MLFKQKVQSKKGFSLIELLIVMVIVLILVGVAAMYLEDYVYKSKVAKAMQDLDMIRVALQLYDATEPYPFRNYNYQAVVGTPAPFGFDFTTYGLASWDPVWTSVGGANSGWTDYSNNSLKTLLGKYLLTLPTDPFGFEYVVNSSAGYVASLGADQSTASNSGKNKDLLMYYLTEVPVLVDVVVSDNDLNNVISAGDFIDFKFSKDVYGPTSVLAANDFQYATEDQENLPVSGLTFDTTISSFGYNDGIIRLRNDARTLRYRVSTPPDQNLIGRKIRFNPSSTTAAEIADNNPYFRQANGRGRAINLQTGNPYVKVRLVNQF